MYFPQVWADTSHRQFAQQKLKNHKLFAEQKAKKPPALCMYVWTEWNSAGLAYPGTAHGLYLEKSNGKTIPVQLF